MTRGVSPTLLERSVPPIERFKPELASFVPRHLRHATVDERGRRHVTAEDEDDDTYLAGQRRGT
jgi:hypothetical protein